MLDPRLMRQAGMAAVLATELAVLWVGGFLLGYGLDRHLGSGPGLTLLLGLMGLVAGIRMAFRRLRDWTDDDDDPPDAKN